MFRSLVMVAALFFSFQITRTGQAIDSSVQKLEKLVTAEDLKAKNVDFAYDGGTIVIQLVSASESQSLYIAVIYPESRFLEKLPEGGEDNAGLATVVASATDRLAEPQRLTHKDVRRIARVLEENTSVASADGAKGIASFVSRLAMDMENPTAWGRMARNFIREGNGEMCFAKRK